MAYRERRADGVRSFHEVANGATTKGTMSTCENCAYLDTDRQPGDAYGMCAARSGDPVHYRRTGEYLFVLVGPTDTCDEFTDR